MRSPIEQAAALIDQADALIIAAGAGMGVDSGLPDFRGTQPHDGFAPERIHEGHGSIHHLQRVARLEHSDNRGFTLS